MENSINQNLIVVNGVRGRLNTNGYPELNLEDVARGLGFTDRQIKNGKEYLIIRKARVNGYLEGFGFLPPVAEEFSNTFIPENIFYKLCFKAENETARQFQDKVTDEILPTIREHGAYLTPETIEKVLLNPDTIIDLATRLKKEQAVRLALEETLLLQKPQVEFANHVAKSADSIDVGALAKLARDEHIDIGRNRLFEWMREHKMLRHNNEPYQKYIENGWFEVSEIVKSTSYGEKIFLKTLVTGKGQIAIIEMLRREFVDKIAS